MSNAPLLALHIDSSLPEVSADAVLFVVILLNGILGWKAGLARRVVAFGGAYLGALAATTVGNGLATLVSGHNVNTNAWFFIGVFVLVTLMIEGLGVLYNDRIQKMIVVTFDRVTGIIGGLILGFLEVAIIYLVATSASHVPGSAVGSGISADAIQKATFSSLVIKAEPAVKGLFSPVLPSDMAGHLTVKDTSLTNNDNGAQPTPS